MNSLSENWSPGADVVTIVTNEPMKLITLEGHAATRFGGRPLGSVGAREGERRADEKRRNCNQESPRLRR
jgi:hypothetical protein